MSIQALRREVDILQSALNPSMETTNIHFTFSGPDKPHGAMRHHILSLTRFRGHETTKRH